MLKTLGQPFWVVTEAFVVKKIIVFELQLTLLFLKNLERPPPKHKIFAMPRTLRFIKFDCRVIFSISNFHLFLVLVPFIEFGTLQVDLDMNL